MLQKTTKKINTLSNSVTVPVRFSEVDALGIVWHGHYLKFFEDGREAFGRQYTLGYMDVYKHQLAVPLVKMNIEFKKIVKYGDHVKIITTFIPSAAAKIIFNYEIYRESDGELVATGDSIQVFMNLQHELQITTPLFFEEWKKKNIEN